MFESNEVAGMVEYNVQFHLHPLSLRQEAKAGAGGPWNWSAQHASDGQCRACSVAVPLPYAFHAGWSLSSDSWRETLLLSGDGPSMEEIGAIARLGFAERRRRGAMYE
jgi:hypothetical protein